MFTNPSFCDECEQKCCRSPYIHMFSTKEITRIPLSLEEKKQKFSYCEEIHDRGWSYMQSPTTGYFLAKRKEDGTCAFLQNKRCEIFEKRGLDCRIYPYFFEFDPNKKELIFNLDESAPCNKSIKEEEIQADLQPLTDYVSKELKNWTTMEILAYTHIKPNRVNTRARELIRIPFDVSSKKF